MKDSGIFQLMSQLEIVQEQFAISAGIIKLYNWE